jgi:hypothetical protein
VVDGASAGTQVLSTGRILAGELIPFPNPICYLVPALSLAAVGIPDYPSHPAFGFSVEGHRATKFSVLCTEP